MKKIILMVFLTMLGLSGCTELKRAKVLLPHSWVGMRKVSSHLYVEDNMSIQVQKKIEKAIPKAKEHVADMYGDVITRPVIYACRSQECAQSLGLGRARGLRLFGHLLLSNKGLNKEIIAHEWSHEELYERIGGFWHWYKEIPIWFDEGLASLTMQTYSRYDEQAWHRIVKEKIPYPKKAEMATLQQWGEVNRVYRTNDSMNVPYATARHIVAKWYEKVGQKGILKLLNSIRNGEKFEELYERK